MRGRLPREPAETGVRFPDPSARGVGEVVAVGEDFRPGTLLAAYRAGIFPWPHDIDGETVVAWFCPLRRTLLPLEDLHWSRSLRRELRHHPYRITFNAAFREVMLACGSEREHGTWILPTLIDGYVALHELGWAHSLEVWSDDELVGGIYGVALGGVLCAESMFHRRTNASKIAFATLAERMRDAGFAIFDAQVMTAHLRSLGCVDVSRARYLSSLPSALATTPAPPIQDW